MPGRLVEIADETRPGDREINKLPKKEAAVVVDDVRDLEPAVVGELVTHEVEGRALHWLRTSAALLAPSMLRRPAHTLAAAVIIRLCQPHRPKVDNPNSSSWKEGETIHVD